jgi:uncharacterized protein YqeY
MSIDVEVLSELYTIMKQYVPSKDRQECADNLMSVMVDMLGDKELKEFGATDSTLKRALKEYVSEDDEDEDEDDIGNW